MAINNSLLAAGNRVISAHYDLTEYLESKIIEAKTIDEAHNIFVLIMRVRKIQTMLQTACTKIDTLEDM